MFLDYTNGFILTNVYCIPMWCVPVSGDTTVTRTGRASPVTQLRQNLCVCVCVCVCCVRACTCACVGAGGSQEVNMNINRIILDIGRSYKEKYGRTECFGW